MEEINDIVGSIRSQLDSKPAGKLLAKKENPESKSVEETNQQLIDEFLTPSNKFSTHWLDILQRPPVIDKLQFCDGLFTVPDYVSRTGIRFKRSGLEGTIVGYEEFTVPTASIESTPKNSLSLNRQASSKLDFVRGRAGFMPFAPGGLDINQEQDEKYLSLHRDAQGLFDIAPGLSRGLEIGVISDTVVSDQEAKDLDQILDNDGNTDVPEPVDNSELLAETLESIDINKTTSLTDDPVESSLIDDLLPAEISFGRGRSAMSDAMIPLTKAKEWAHVVDVNKQITNFDELVPSMAREFPFELDIFQKEAVYHLEQGDSVFVAAHTSAGKTVVAEYAIAMSNRNMTKTIYTSPIKALSNQKFRDFKNIFDDVGILTGDVQINPEASCLIMTTEILRSMLYRGADIIRDVEFVIFDEVHYVNDQDRGVVWEEVIIMLPDHIKFILLSATVPNTFEFANWVGRTKKKDIYVISTPKRPVPLEHFLWAKNNKYMIVDEHRKFLELGWKQANDAAGGVKPPGGSGGGPSNRGGSGGPPRGPSGRGARGGSARGGGGGSRGGASRGSFRGGFNQSRGHNSNMPGKTQILQLCQHLHKNNLLPVVVFIFSKKRCEEYAMMLTAIDYTTAKEKSEIHIFIDKAVSRLKKEDRELPQILRVRELLSRGIGVHHGGLLPIVKEVIEILFARTLVKILFATETFAMGLNLPTRTVVFAGTRKHDGKTFRSLLPGEYTQMAGRAGRRGLDPTGTVIMMVSDPEAPSMSLLQEMILGTPTKLHSQFRLTYNMILNLLRIEALRVEEMIKRSFSENASQVLLPEHEKNVKLNEALLANFKRDPCSVCDQDIEPVHAAIVRSVELTNLMLISASKTPIGRKMLAPGRVIIYQRPNMPLTYGFIVKTDARQHVHLLTFAQSANKVESKSESYSFLCIFPGFIERLKIRPAELSARFVLDIVDFSDIVMVLDYKLKVLVLDVLRGNKEVEKIARSQLQRFLRNPSKWGEVSWNVLTKSSEFNIMLEERSDLIETVIHSKSFSCPNFERSYLQFHEEYEIRRRIDNLKHLISDQNLELLPDYEQRIEVLKDLSYIDDDSNVLLKGRVACEISTGFELIITELVLDNFLGDYEPEEIVALMSAFLFEGNTNVEAESVSPKLDNGKARILEIARDVGEIYQRHQVLVTQEEAEFDQKKRFGLMEAVYEWARGMTFNAITQLTDVPEGTIVRVITRLDEICRQVMAAARIIGDASLYDKMALAQEKIKRDIVFCASLYL